MPSPRSPLSPIYPIPPIPIIPIIPPIPPKKLDWNPRQRIKKKVEENLPPTLEWKGNVPEFAITGVYKKYDVIYGMKRISRQTIRERPGFKPRRGRRVKQDAFGKYPKQPKIKPSSISKSVW